MQFQILKNGFRRKIFSGQNFKVILTTKKSGVNNECCSANNSSGVLKIIKNGYSLSIHVRGIENN